MPHIDLDEPAVNPILCEMADIGMPCGMGGQGLRETERVPIGHELRIPIESVRPFRSNPYSGSGVFVHLVARL